MSHIEAKSNLQRLYLAGLIEITRFNNLNNALNSSDEKVRKIAMDSIKKKSKRLSKNIR